MCALKKVNSSLPMPKIQHLNIKLRERCKHAFKNIRSLPIIDCLMKIERYVAIKWVENVSKGKGWGVLTSHTSRKVVKTLAAALWG